MQGRECGEGMNKSEMGLRSLGQGSQISVWNGEGQAGLSTWSSKNRTKVCGWMGYTVGVLEQVRVMEKCRSEFQCSVTQSVT